MEELTIVIEFGGAVLLLWLFVILLRKVGSLYWVGRDSWIARVNLIRDLCMISDLIVSLKALHDIFLFWSTAVGSKYVFEEL